VSRTFAAGRAGIWTSLLITSFVAGGPTAGSVAVRPAPRTISPLTVADARSDFTRKGPTALFRAIRGQSTLMVSFVIAPTKRTVKASGTTVKASSSTSARPLPSRPMTSASSKVTYLGGASGAVNGFYYGYCTWWVAHKRYVPWRGNAAQWWWNARPFGLSEGSAPRVGAIMVMGVGPWSPEGHVAYVEEVRPDGSFVVSEMNWGRWGVVDLRTITSLKGVLGFIY